MNCEEKSEIWSVIGLIDWDFMVQNLMENTVFIKLVVIDIIKMWNNIIPSTDFTFS